MTKEELKDLFTSLGFTRERDKEYNRDVYTNGLFFVTNRNTKLEIFVDYYTIRFQWWYEPNKKVGNSFYLKSVLPNFDANFIKSVVVELCQTYNIK